MPKATLSAILHILESQGDAQYGGEAVTQKLHALQCATLAQEQGASPELITACLLHDLGHLVHALGEDVAAQGVDDRHEYLAMPWLQPLFPETVTMPIRLHVQAKRYLCAVDDTYWANLSPASRHSLVLQGGCFSAAEAMAFIALPHAETAVQLRLWDEQAKVPGQATPNIKDFRPVLERALILRT